MSFSAPKAGVDPIFRLLADRYHTTYKLFGVVGNALKMKLA
jgi:hypothetical protein